MYIICFSEKEDSITQKDKELLSLLQEYHNATRYEKLYDKSTDIIYLTITPRLGDDLKFKCSLLENNAVKLGDDIKNFQRLLQERLIKFANLIYYKNFSCLYILVFM